MTTTRKISLHDLSKLDAAGRSQLLKRSEASIAPILDKVRPIIEAVKNEGDVALARFAREFDKSPVNPDAIAATPKDFDDALVRLDQEVLKAVEFAVESIRKFHTDQKPEEMWLHEIRPGAFAGDRFIAIPSVACYVPRGKGAFPSVVMMTTIPGRRRRREGDLHRHPPPGPDGKIDDATLVAARLVGVDRVYKCGGAQAVAAVAYGTQTVQKCAKIVGPGSPWSWPRSISSPISSIPACRRGPSEAIILADETADGRIAALDLLIESEHGRIRRLSSSPTARRSRRMRSPRSRASGTRWARSASATPRPCSAAPMAASCSPGPSTRPSPS